MLLLPIGQHYGPTDLGGSNLLVLEHRIARPDFASMIESSVQLPYHAQEDPMNPLKRLLSTSIQRKNRQRQRDLSALKHERDR